MSWIYSTFNLKPFCYIEAYMLKKSIDFYKDKLPMARGHIKCNKIWRVMWKEMMVVKNYVLVTI